MSGDCWGGVLEPFTVAETQASPGTVYQPTHAVYLSVVPSL
jgi:hypothetical protein